MLRTMCGTAVNFSWNHAGKLPTPPLSSRHLLHSSALCDWCQPCISIPKALSRRITPVIVVDCSQAEMECVSLLSLASNPFGAIKLLECYGKSAAAKVNRLCTSVLCLQDMSGVHTE